jgi:5-methylcytosine-specific restriction protein B
MSRASDSEYSLERARDLIDEIEKDASMAERVIRNASGEEVIEYLIEEGIDVTHDGPRGLGSVRRAMLESEDVSFDLKRSISTRGDSTDDYDILVPEDVHKNAVGALKSGKPVVLYGPTGTGKTTFAKQLATTTSVGYSLNTASPSWTAQEIIGGIRPEYSGGSVSYRTQLGCVSEGVQRARDFGEDYSVIIDEITRADISQIFGPLYTAIENPHQTMFETDDGKKIELDPEVNIICTMNMSDRTVNQLDNAITRRFAMIEVNEYSEDSRLELFSNWTKELVESDLDTEELVRLFESDYTSLNSGGPDSSPIMQFGPMHYEDVSAFLKSTCMSDGDYKRDEKSAVGEAFKTYIVPRILNTASLPKIKRVKEHYESLNEQFDFDLTPAVELARSQEQAEQHKLGAYE